MPRRLQKRIAPGLRYALRYLEQCQDEDGAWTPLWFGNQHVAAELNRTYATAHVLLALSEVDVTEFPAVRVMLDEGRRWLEEAQDATGGWGGDAGCPPSIEETALAIAALAALGTGNSQGVDWLLEATAGGCDFPPSPIGFYFAKLWYFERLYPQVWVTDALGRASQLASKK